MKRTTIVLGLTSLLAVLGPAAHLSASASRESRIFYSACAGSYVNGECKDQAGNTTRTEIFSVKPTGESRHRVTENTKFEQHLLWNRSGSHFVFERSGTPIDCDYNSSLARSRSDGSGNADSITKAGSYRCDEPTDWHPNADRFLFTREGNLCRDIMVVKSDGSGRKQLTHICDRNDPDSYNSDPNWGRDGTRILFSRNAYPNDLDGIYMMRADGTNKHKVDLGSKHPGDFDVSPGGHTLAFAVYTKSGYSLWTSNLNGGDRKKLAEHAGIDYVRWSPDGNKILFTGLEGNGGGSLYVVNRDGSNLRNLDGPKLNAISAREIYGGYWSPDSRRVTFVVDARDYSSHAVAVMEADGSDVKLLTDYEKNVYVWGWERIPTN